MSVKNLTAYWNSVNIGDHILWVCADCGHEHGGGAHGFCCCGCTFPGEKKVG